MRDKAVKMSQRKPTNSILSFDDLLNDKNDWLAEENSESDEIGNNLDELCGEEEEIDSKVPTKVRNELKRPKTI